MSRPRQPPPSALSSLPKPVATETFLSRSDSATPSQGSKEERTGMPVEDLRLPSARPHTSLAGAFWKRDHTTSKRSTMLLDAPPTERHKISTCGEGPSSGGVERATEAGVSLSGETLRAGGHGRAPGVKNTARDFERRGELAGRDWEDIDEPPGFERRGGRAQHGAIAGVNREGLEGSRGEHREAGGGACIERTQPRRMVTLRKSAPPMNNNVPEMGARSEQNTSEEDMGVGDCPPGLFELGSNERKDDEREEERVRERCSAASEAAPMMDTQEEEGEREEYIKVVDFLTEPIFHDPADGTKVVVDRVCLREGLEPVFAVRTALQHYQNLLPLFDTHENERVAEHRGSARPDLKSLKCMVDNQLCANSAPRIGTVMGVGVGSTFSKKTQLQVVGLHFAPMKGIYWSTFPEYGGAKIALAVVNKVGEYEGEQDSGEELLYTGEGGREGKYHTRNQMMLAGNLALKNSCALSSPVRVIRGHNEGYSYDGLYHVAEWWEEQQQHGDKILIVFLFRLVREAGQGGVPKPVTGDKQSKPKLKKKLLMAGVL